MTEREGLLAEAELLIRNQLGLHARACALFVKAAARFQSQVFVARDELEVNGKSIMGVMMLAAAMGSIVRIKTEGSDEDKALAAIAALFENKFNED